MIGAFIDDYKHRWGIEPICAVLTEHGVKIAPSTYYAARTRRPSARSLRDEELKIKIMASCNASKQVYGIRKIHVDLVRDGVQVAQCTIEQLCRDLGIRGVVPGKFPRTTRPTPETDLVDRDFTADAPNQLWVADVTYVRTAWAGCTSRSFSTCTHGSSSVGSLRPACSPTWRSTRWPWRYGSDAVTGSPSTG